MLARFDEALDAGPTHPDYTLLVTGERGTGKTALLNVLEARAARRGWDVITAAASSEAVSDRITGAASRLVGRMRSGRRRRSRRPRVSSVKALGVGVSLEPEDRSGIHSAAGGAGGSLLAVLEELGELLSAEGRGLLLTVDELHDVSRDDVRDVASAVQIVTRRRLNPVAFAAAALPLVDQTHLADANMTFLQRCARAPVGMLEADETRRALREPIEASGAEIGDDALDEAVAATLGYPYTIQLVGFHAWRARRDPCAPIGLIEVRAGAAEAEHEMVVQIAGPVWNRLSPMDKRFLVAMLPDEPDSALSDIARRIGRSAQYARTYRRRLVAAGAITPAARARVRFRHHALRTRARAAAREDPCDPR